MNDKVLIDNHTIQDISSTADLSTQIAVNKFTPGGISCVTGVDGHTKTSYLRNIAKHRLYGSKKVLHIQNNGLTDYDLNINNYINEYNVITPRHMIACVNKHKPNVLLIDGILFKRTPSTPDLLTKKYNLKYISLFKNLSDQGVEIYFTGMMKWVVPPPNLVKTKVVENTPVLTKGCLDFLNLLSLNTSLCVGVITDPFIIISPFSSTNTE